MTYEEFTAANPVFTVTEHDAATGETTTTEVTADSDPERYEAIAQDRYALQLEAEATQADQDADHAEGKGIMGKMTALETTAARLKDPAEVFTFQQIRNVLAEHMLVTAQSIRYIHKHSNLPQDEE